MTRKRIFLDDLEEVVQEDSAENDGATYPNDLDSWMEKNMGARDDPTVALFTKGQVIVRLAGRTFHLSLVIEEELP